MAQLASSPAFDRERHMAELEDQGYTVVPGVLDPASCDAYIADFHRWLGEFGDKFPQNTNSVFHSYGMGHFQQLWEARLKVKPIFASIWGTQKLLTSFDGASIAAPSETGRFKFADPNSYWFHCDQGPRRQGLHGYQGALYLEETTDTDWCLRVLKGSHKLHKELFGSERAQRRWKDRDFCRLDQADLNWFAVRGCLPTKVPVPKGGLVLWDSRTIHDSVAPELGRPNQDRWRFVLFIAMVPAAWARHRDLELKRAAYANLLTSAHWPAQGTRNFKTGFRSKAKEAKHWLQRLPDVARTPEARLLAGVDLYDFEDGEPVGPDWSPEWVYFDL